jgi:NMT1/THI5 like
MSTRTPFDRRRFLRLSALGGAGLLGGASVLAACGDDDDDGAGGATTATGGTAASTATTSAATTSGPASTASGPATTGGTAPVEARTLNVQLGWIANVENAGEFVAADKGYYENEGLAPTLTPGGPGAILEPTVVSGAALIGLSSADTIARRQRRGRRPQDRRCHAAEEPVGRHVAGIEPGADGEGSGGQEARPPADRRVDL